MHVYTLRCEMLTHCALQETFKVFEDPHNLARITPSWLNFRVVSEEVQMRKGAEIDYVIKWFGLPIHWKTRIQEYEPPFYFVDEQAKGPYALWRHAHTFEPTDQGTRVGDQVEYALPFGMLGGLAHSLKVRRQLEEIFRYRQAQLGKLLGGSTVEVQEPVING